MLSLIFNNVYFMNIFPYSRVDLHLALLLQKKIILSDVAIDERKKFATVIENGYSYITFNSCFSCSQMKSKVIVDIRKIKVKEIREKHEKRK